MQSKIKKVGWKKELESDFENFDDRISEPLCMFDRLFVLVLQTAVTRLTKRRSRRYFFKKIIAFFVFDFNMRVFSRKVSWMRSKRNSRVLTRFFRNLHTYVLDILSIWTCQILNMYEHTFWFFPQSTASACGKQLTVNIWYDPKITM